MPKNHGGQQSAGTNASKIKGQELSREDWEGLADGLLAPRGLSEEQLDAFKRTWYSIDESERDKVDARAEEYSDFEDYRYRMLLSKGARKLIKENFPVVDIYREQIDGIFELLFHDPQMRSSSSYAKERIGKVLTQVNDILRATFAVPAEAHRPVSKEEQHRNWSRMLYLGRSYKEIADEASYGNAEGVTEDHVQKSIMRYRKRREPVQWALRHTILNSQART
jgi:hypothetical protein